MMMTSFSQLYRTVGCIYVMILGIFAMIDSMNSYNYPIYAWRAMITVEVVAMILGLIWTVRGLLAHATKQAHVKERGEVVAALLGKNATSSDKSIAQTRDFIDSVSKSAVNFVFFGVLSVTSLWALISVLFIYDYTMDLHGYQAELDRGFPTDSAFYFAVNHKFQLMFIIQLQMVQALAICIVGFAAGQAAKHHASL